jgi:hypothetical protein
MKRPFLMQKGPFCFWGIKFGMAFLSAPRHHSVRGFLRVARQQRMFFLLAWRLARRRVWHPTYSLPPGSGIAKT